MKNTVKYFLVSALIALSAQVIYAQQSASVVAGDSRRPASVPQNKIPKDIVVRYTKEYPNAVAARWYDFEPAFAGETWKEYDPYAADRGHGHSYVVEFGDQKVSYTVIYLKNGKKVSGRKTSSHVTLPAAITNSISGGKYKGWTIGAEITEMFRDSENDRVKVYKVTITNGSEKRYLYYQQDGSLLKDVKSA